jgi:deubiquitinase DESI2
MSSFGGGSGGRTRMSIKVVLNVYDLSPMNDILYPVGFGLHHSGVEIMGTEFSFASGAGVFEGQPKDVPNAKFREQIEMGLYDGTMAQINSIIQELRTTNFGPDDYNLVRRNCNHFANAFCWKLLKKQIPGYVNRLADVGVCCSCLLPKKLLENSPVGDSNKSTESSSFLVRAPTRPTTQSTTANGTAQAFHGNGLRLGGVATNSDSVDGRFSIRGLVSSSQGPVSRQDDLTDRREKVRKAALARFEMQQQQQQQQHQTDSDKSQ